VQPENRLFINQVLTAEDKLGDLKELEEAATG
jgi:hypothetical protein